MSTDAEFLKQVQQAFANSVTQLDTHSLTRLRAARTAALAAAAVRVPIWRSRWALPAGAAALTCAIAIASFVWLNFGAQPSAPFVTHNGEDMSIMLSGDNLDMYADMDFYKWLQTEPQDAVHTGAGGKSNG